MPLQTLLAGMPQGKVRADDLLGFLVMYTVPDRMVDYRGVVRHWTNAGLDAQRLPRPGSPVDIFQLACVSVATKRKRGEREIVLVERAASDGCTYQITRSLRDDANRVVEHPKAMTFQFDPRKESLHVTRREEFDALHALENRVRTAYRAYKDQIPGSKVRSAIRETVTAQLGGTNYMGKGAYLVPREGLRTLESIEDVLGALYGGDAHISLIPMLNTNANKDDLSRFHADEIKERCESLMATVAGKLRTGGTVRSDLRGNVLREFREIKQQRAKILDLVGRETQTVEDHIDLLQDQILKFIDLAGGSDDRSEMEMAV